MGVHVVGEVFLRVGRQPSLLGERHRIDGKSPRGHLEVGRRGRRVRGIGRSPPYRKRRGAAGTETSRTSAAFAGVLPPPTRENPYRSAERRSFRQGSRLTWGFGTQVMRVRRGRTASWCAVSPLHDLNQRPLGYEPLGFQASSDIVRLLTGCLKFCKSVFVYERWSAKGLEQTLHGICHRHELRTLGLDEARARRIDVFTVRIHR